MGKNDFMKVVAANLEILIFSLKDEPPWLKASDKVYLVFNLPDFPIIKQDYEPTEYMPAIWDREHECFTTLEGGGIKMPITHWSPVI